MDKLHSYQGWSGRYNEWRGDIMVRYANWREANPETVIELVKKKAKEQAAGGGHSGNSDDPDDFSHIYRLGLFRRLSDYSYIVKVCIFNLCFMLQLCYK